MGCRSCQGGKAKMDVCEVHRLVDGDLTIRLVKWCELCKAFICDDCRPNMLKRAAAAARRILSSPITKPNPVSTTTQTIDQAGPFLAIIDIETGGFSKTKNGLAEIGIMIISYDGTVHLKKCWLIKPYPRHESVQETPGQLVSYKEDAMKVNGLTIEQLESEGLDATEAAALLDSILDNYQIDTLVGHNIKSFDWPWIDHFLSRFGKINRDPGQITGLIDTMLLAKEQHKGLASYGLQELCAHFQISTGDQHRSGGDIEATRCLLLKIGFTKTIPIA